MIQAISRQEILCKLDHFERHRFVEITHVDSYDYWHLPKAVNLPLRAVATRGPNLLPNHGEQLIIYDEGGGAEAMEAARQLQTQGHRVLYVYEGGKRDWISEGEMGESQIEPNPAMYNPNYPLSIFP